MGSKAMLGLSLAITLPGAAVVAHAAPSVSANASTPHFTLTVVAEGVRNAKGVVGVLVFRSAAGWPERFSAALKAQSSPAQPGVTDVVISDLPPGDYGVVV